MDETRQTGNAPATPPKSAVGKKWLVAILVLAFAFVLMPFLLWYSTTFTRPLTDAEVTKYLNDAEHPRNAQHALSRIADRMGSADPAVRTSARQWYPEVVRLSEQGIDQLRVTAAWVMGQDNQSPEFHAALLKQLQDPNPMVRRNAALSLVRFDDTSGHDIITAMLGTYTMSAPYSGIVSVRIKPGEAINPGTLLGHIKVSGQETEVRSKVPGTIRQWVATGGSEIRAGEPMLLIDPSSDVVWESLRALYLIGQKQDLPAVSRYARGAAGMPPQVQKQAELTAQAIAARNGK
jgi:biotin carboxyl carrier protein